MQKALQYEVSNTDFKKRIHYPFKLVLYPQLTNYADITQLLPNQFSILIILLEAGSGNHWTCLIRRNNVLTYFDSYGKKYDGEFYLIPKATQIQLGEQSHYLTTLLLNAQKQGFKLQYNKVDFQSHANGIDTCGKWVYAFIEASIDGHSLKEFQVMMKQAKQKTGKSYDEIVCDFWNSHKLI
jgi:hypothetical protein